MDRADVHTDGGGDGDSLDDGEEDLVGEVEKEGGGRPPTKRGPSRSRRSSSPAFATTTKKKNSNYFGLLEDCSTCSFLPSSLLLLSTSLALTPPPHPHFANGNEAKQRSKLGKKRREKNQNKRDFSWPVNIFRTISSFLPVAAAVAAEEEEEEEEAE